VLCAKDFVARFEVGYIFSNRFDDTGEVRAETRVLRFAQPAKQSPEPRVSDHVPIDRIDGRRTDANENLIISRCGLPDLLKLEIVYAVLAAGDGFHGIARGCGHALAIVGRSPVGDEQPSEQDDDNRQRSPFENPFYFHTLTSEAG